MGRHIDIVTGKHNGNVVRGKRQDRKVVAGRPTLALRTFLTARSLLVRFARCLRAGHSAMRHCPAISAAPIAIRAMEPRGSDARMRWQGWLSRPGYPLGGSRF
jgi:hypothetical protein